MHALKSIDPPSQTTVHRSGLEADSDDGGDSLWLDAARDVEVLIYIDPWALTRDCVSSWLQKGMSEFELRAINAPQSIEALALPEDRVREVIVNTGPDPIASPAVARTVADLLELLPAAPIALLSHHEDRDSIRKAFELGVAGYIPANLAAQVVVGAVRLIGLGGTFAPTGALLSQDAAAAVSEPAGDAVIEGFTQRQSEILDCLRRGMANKLIAYELGMCESTVKVHIRNIMRKLNATNRTEVAYLTRDFFKDMAATACRAERARPNG